MVALLALVVFLFWGAIFLTFFQSEEQSFLALFLGHLEPLPPDLGQWSKLEETPSTAEFTERRTLHEPGCGGGTLIIQERIRSRELGTIVRVREERRRRRRHR